MAIIIWMKNIVAYGVGNLSFSVIANTISNFFMLFVGIMTVLILAYYFFSKTKTDKNDKSVNNLVE